MSTRRPKAAEGIAIRHRLGCPAGAGGGCACRPGFQAQVFSPADGRTIRKTFGSLAEARAWRAETLVGLRRGTVSAPSKLSLREAANAWLVAADSGVVRTRSGDRYKPSALRSYRLSLDARVVPKLGNMKLSAVTRPVVQDFVDGLVADGLAPSSVRNTVLPLRAIMRRAVARMEVAHNPTKGLALPAVRSRRERVARPQEANALVAALSAAERAIYATALYAGLRRGELQALRWGDVDFESGVIRVERGWDDQEGPIEPKSRAGRRRVPLTGLLRAELAAHGLRQPPNQADLVFTNHRGDPFSSGWVAERARRRWRQVELDPIGLHECRHTYASFMIAAGVNAKALSVYMGHSSIVVTLDRYGHLMPGNETEAADMLGAYLEAAKRDGSGR